MTTLNQEKFSTLKALAEVQSNLSQGRAELLKLKETTEEYMVVREKEAEERIIKVLKESCDALEETSKNHQELSNYSRDLTAYADELKVLSTDIVALFKDFNERMREAEIDMKENHKLVSETLKNVKLERVHVSEDRKMLERERQQTNEASLLLIDRRTALERGFAELKRLQIK